MSQIQKKCHNSCPKCGVSDTGAVAKIDWEKPTIGRDDLIYQNGTCLVCRKEFVEVYVYARTESEHQY